jgi:hypothetical protein
MGFAPQPIVTIEDSLGQVATGDTSQVTLNIEAGTGAAGAALTCTGGGSSAVAVAGIATFVGCSINLEANGYVLQASDSADGLTGTKAVNSSPIDITAGAATQLVFTHEPGGAVAGSPLSPQPVVAVEDANGNVVTSDTSTVTLAITAGTGRFGAALTCGTNPLQVTNGVATFTGCSINDFSGNNYELTATDGTLTQAVSNPFGISGAVAQIAFTTQPGGASAGSVFTQQPVVAVEDAFGNVVASDNTDKVTISIAAGSPAGTLTCTNATLTVTNGVANFAGCKINNAGNNYRLAAVDGAFNANSFRFNVAGTATQVVFTTSPSSAPIGSAFPTQPVVAVEDASGNIVTSDNTSQVALTIAAGSPAGTLTCTSPSNTVTVVNGVANFVGCAIGTAGNNFRLTATDGSLTPGTSARFNILAPTQVVFTTEPTGASKGVAFTTQPVVEVEDAFGDVVTSDSSSTVTLAITPGTGTAGAKLSCTPNLSLKVTNGVANFVGCAIDTAGNNYRLTATDGTLTPANSFRFNVVGPASQLVFSTSPSDGAIGSAFTIQPVVSVEDTNGNVVTTDTSSVTLAITAGTGTAGATLSCTGGLTLPATAGVANFAGCAINTAGTRYTLTATDGTLTSATSFRFNVLAASQIVFTTSPRGAAAATAFTTQPVVAVEDSAGDIVTSDSSSTVTLSITSGTGTAGAALSCTPLALKVTAGVASFTGCSINDAGYGYQLHAVDGALTGDSNPFDVNGPYQLGYLASPFNGTISTPFTQQPQVAVEDLYGNVWTADSTSAVTLSITTGTGTTGASLACTTNPVTVTNGIATFAGCSINLAGTGYQLHAVDGTLQAADSNPFNVNGPYQLAFTTQPGGTINAGSAFQNQPVVTVEDVYGRPYTTDNTSSVTLSITTGTGTSGASLNCTTNPLRVTNGVAHFAGCAINLVGKTYTLTAIDGTLQSATSNPFNVNGPYQVAFTTQPGGTITAGAAFPIQPVVKVQDTFGAVVTTDNTSTVTLALTGAGTLTCTGGDTLTVRAGVAAFAGCSVNAAGQNDTLTATDGTLLSATSNKFNVIGPAAKVVFTTQPGTGAIGSALSAQPVVAVEDSAGNILTTDNTDKVTLAITTGTGTVGAALACTTNPVTVRNGVATFANCNINLAGNGYTLTATSGGLTPATSSAFNVLPASKLVFTTTPIGSLGAGAQLAPQPVVTVEDSNGDVVTSDSSSTVKLTISCTANPVTVRNGVATFAGCSINQAGTFTITATDGSLTPAVSGNVYVL